MTWYNENDPKTAAWLRELIRQGHLPKGTLDSRSIEEVAGADFSPTSHFFAGIGGWPLALQMAGWTGPAWTGSCPCQPFSSAGKRKGTDDERHLWPAWFRLVAECRPPVIFGEQVASRLGREWLSGVRADLESVGYEVGAADLCAASVGAPHIRQRLFWVAHAKGGRFDWGKDTAGGSLCRDRDTAKDSSPAAEVHKEGTWDNWVLVESTGKERRRTQPGVFPLAHGVPSRVVRLRGYGNAIVPQVAAVFVRAFMDATEGK